MALPSLPQPPPTLAPSSTRSGGHSAITLPPSHPTHALHAPQSPTGPEGSGRLSLSSLSRSLFSSPSLPPRSLLSLACPPSRSVPALPCHLPSLPTSPSPSATAPSPLAAPLALSSSPSLSSSLSSFLSSSLCSSIASLFSRFTPAASSLPSAPTAALGRLKAVATSLGKVAHPTQAEAVAPPALRAPRGFASLFSLAASPALCDEAPVPTDAAPTLASAAAEVEDKAERLSALLAGHAAMEAEAARLHEALARQEAADAMRLMEALQRQQEDYAAQLAAAKVELEARMAERFLDEQQAMRELNDKQLQALHDEHAMHLREAVQLAEATAREKMEEAVAIERAAARELAEQAVLKERQAYLDTLKRLELDVDVLARVLSHDSLYKRTSHAVLQMAASTRSLEQPSIGGMRASLANGVVDQLGDELLGELAQALSEHSSQPLASMKQLQTRFTQVQSAGEQAILVPEGGGMWGHALAAVISTAMGMVRIPHDSMANRFEASSVIASAADWMDQGNLLEAVREMRRLQGQPALACVGWLESAEHRLLNEQVRAAMQAEVDIALGAMC
mmetsp:Transcript_7187/g.20411  ORF Transcript_7187/g.20411 Transcript_7187/m.20411 type:complete len:565 (+) Transcript_7187:2-1696(+)